MLRELKVFFFHILREFWGVSTSSKLSSLDFILLIINQVVESVVDITYGKAWSKILENDLKKLLSMSFHVH